MEAEHEEFQDKIAGRLRSRHVVVFAGSVTKVSAGMIVEASRGIQNGLMRLGASVERLDATGGLGRHMLSVASYAQLAGWKLLVLDQYFSRISGEYAYDNYILKVENASARSVPNMQLIADVTIKGIGGGSNAEVTIPVVVEGDPQNSKILRLDGTSVVNLGPLDANFGIPYIAAVELRLSPSPHKDLAADLSRTVRNLDANGAAAEFPPHIRRDAARRLAGLGAFGWETLEDLRTFLASGAEQDESIVDAITTAVRDLSTFEPRATAAILLSTGELLEPVSLLTSGTASTQRIVAARSTKSSWLKIATVNGLRSRRYGQAGGISFSAVKQANIQLNRNGVSYSGDLQKALNDARDLGEKLRQLIPPRRMTVRDSGIYGLVRELLEPTFDQLREALETYQELTPEFEQRFEAYENRRVLDPVLTHVAGVQLLGESDEFVRITITMTVVDNSGTNPTTTETVEVDVPERFGEVMIPIPLRAVSQDRHTVKLTLTQSKAVDFLFTHLTGLIGDFEIRHQTSSNAISFEVERFVA